MNESTNNPSAHYSPTELAAIHRAIAPPPPPAPPSAPPMPEAMQPFWKLADLAPDLFRRIAADPWAQALSHYAFFPPVITWRQAGRPIPNLRITGRTRGPAAILQSDADAIVIKPHQNTRENEIARLAAAVNAGPTQLPSLPGYLTERFANGTFFTDLPPERRDNATMQAIGYALGGILRRLHDAGIYYNDATLADPEGRSHLIIDLDAAGSDTTNSTLPVTLIDYGVSLLVTAHPEYTREEVHNFARTLPMYRIFANIAETRAEMDNFLAACARQMAQTSPDDILARDLKFAQQGLSLAARRMGESIIAPLRDGFIAGYRPGR